MTYNLSWQEVEERATKIANNLPDCKTYRIYGIPRGGIFPAILVQRMLVQRGVLCYLTEYVKQANLFVDDIIGSGVTRDKYHETYGEDKDFIVLVDKLGEDDCWKKEWVSFPWERMTKDDGPVENIRRLIEYIGDDPKREGLKETPDRVIRSYKKLFGGYAAKKELTIKVFADSCDEMVILKDVEFYSTCLAGSTFIETPKGRIPINRINDGEFVYCWDEGECKMTIARCVAPRITGRGKRLWRVYTDKDSVLCTSTHKFLTHTRGWIKAKDLTPGDSIVSLNKEAIVWSGKVPRASIKAYWDSLTPEERAARNHRVLLVEKTNWFEDVWCMDVPGYENFVANGMVVHNCEHHMLPFFGKAHIAYIPNGQVIGISKLVRILEMYSRRLQIQERICQQVVMTIKKTLSPLGAACVLEAQHFCMTSRGVEKQNSIMVTSSLVGIFKEQPEVRAEFMNMIGK